MFVVGLTGGVGSGKSTVTRCFQNFGVCTVDADDLSREVVQLGSKALDEVARHFGSKILQKNGTLDRSQLRQIVFTNPTEKVWLEGLLHPLIADLIQIRLTACGSAYCLLASPLLLETDQHKFVDRVLVVDVSEETQFTRTFNRDGGDPMTIRAIIASQTERNMRLKRADDILINERSEAALKREVTDLHNQYLKFAVIDE